MVNLRVESFSIDIDISIDIIDSVPLNREEPRGNWLENIGFQSNLSLQLISFLIFKSRTTA